MSSLLLADETKIKMSDVSKGRSKSEEHKKKISETNKGRKRGNYKTNKKDKYERNINKK